MLDPAAWPRLLLSLESATHAHPFDRKLLLCRRPAEGRELLHALASAGVAWVGWETVTLRSIALEVAATELAREAVSPADDFDGIAAADEAIDAVRAAGDAGTLASGAGVRDAVRSAIATLRRAGIGPDALRAARPGDPRLSPLAAMLEAYGTALARRGRDDDAGIVRRAVASLESGTAPLPDARIHLVPGLPLRGAAGRLVRWLIGHGAEVLETDPVLGIDPPAGVLWSAPEWAAAPLSALHLDAAAALPAPRVELFAAATPADEVREVLRRVLHDGVPFDSVEIVATDPGLYGAALDSLGRRMEAADGCGVPATFAEGVDLGRTRVGRALAGWFRWVDEGFPAGILRSLLYAGDLAAGDHDPAALADRLRRLRIGWGRDRYLPALDAARGALEYSPEELIVGEARESGGVDGALRAGEELDALRSILEPILAATPRAPDRLRAQPVRASPASIAAGALAFLGHVPARTPAEAHVRAVARARLERARTTLTRETSWAAALSTLRALLEIPVAPGGDDGLAPWTATGGRLHLSSLLTGGLASRRVTFVTGLSASAGTVDRVADPLLADTDRELLNRHSADPVPPLATPAEARFELAALLARLRGRVTLSYAARGAADGREASPAPELLQALRHRERSAALGYRELRAALGPPASAVPRDHRLLDAADAWLAAVAGGGTMRDGRRVIRQAFPGLDRGAIAADARAGTTATAWHGIVARPSGARLPDALSASALETLGTCPRRFMYRYLLALAPGAEPEWNAGRWLTPAARGSVLHRVFERTLREARLFGDAIGSPGFTALASEVLEVESARAARRIPAPSESVRAAEVAELERDLRCWLEMVRDPEARWLHLEYRFGPGDGELAIGQRGISLRGTIDRIDEVAPGRVRVIDYKSGKAARYHPRRPLAGGRRVQHLVYALAANRLLGAEVESTEFHFPTRAGRNERVVLPAPGAARAEAILERMASLAADGPYLPTDDARDCAWCDFAAVCRVTVDEFGGPKSPPAGWMKAVGIGLPEGRAVAAMRACDG